MHFRHRTLLKLATSLTFLVFSAACDIVGHDIPDAPGTHFLPKYKGQPATANPLPPKNFPAHPFLAPVGTLHVDLRQTDVFDVAGPLGISPEVNSRFYGLFDFWQLIVWDFQERLYALCTELDGTNVRGQLTWIDPQSLKKLAKYTIVELPLDAITDISRHVRKFQSGSVTAGEESPRCDDSCGACIPRLWGIIRVRRCSLRAPAMRGRDGNGRLGQGRGRV